MQSYIENAVHRLILQNAAIARAAMAKTDASRTGDQEVAGSIPARSGNILSWGLIMKYFSTAILSLPLVQEGQFSVSGERMCISSG